jgi:NADH-quinone oxidoreductase subunit L
MIGRPLWLIPLLPLAASGLILVVPGHRVRFGYIASSATLATAILSLFNLLASATGILRSDVLQLHLAGRVLQAGYVGDPLASIMAVIVSWIATPVFFYSIGYMEGEEAPRRFFAILTLFTAAMLSLVLAGDYLLLYLSWEVVGFCSYLLIGHETDKVKNSKAAYKAFAITRIGDLGLLAGMALMLAHVGTLDFAHVFASALHDAGDFSWLAVAVLLIIGAAGKSAQFPLHWWLPDAMAGPTPVSALLHSATMVAAGVYLLARSLPILHVVPRAQTLMLSIGVITAVGAAASACVQTDLKRLLAYSTMSQIGEMFIALAAGDTLPGIFHLLAQATFKALLFVAAGIVVKAAGTNEISKLHASSKTAYVGFLVGALSLSGFPPLAGFWSREAISRDAHGWISAVLLALALLSGFYISRAFLLAFASRSEGEEKTPWSMHGGVYTLVAFTILGGFLQSPWTRGWLGRFLQQPQSTQLNLSSLYDPALAALGWFAALVLYHRHTERDVPARWRTLLRAGFGTDYLPSGVARASFALAHMFQWCEERVFNRTAEGAIDAVLSLARIGALLEERGFNRAAEGAVNGVLSLAQVGAFLDERTINRPIMASAEDLGTLGGMVRTLQTGKIYHYLAAAFAWIIVIAIFVLVVRVK